jgi:hypothetical protein
MLYIDYKASNVRMNWKISGRKRSWYNRGINIPAFSWRTKNISKVGRCPGRDSNGAPIKYKSRELPLSQTARCPLRESSRDFLSHYTEWTIRVPNNYQNMHRSAHLTHSTCLSKNGLNTTPYSLLPFHWPRSVCEHSHVRFISVVQCIMYSIQRTSQNKVYELPNRITLYCLFLNWSLRREPLFFRHNQRYSCFQFCIQRVCSKGQWTYLETYNKKSRLMKDIKGRIRYYVPFYSLNTIAYL